jgi:hypothetical protein
MGAAAAARGGHYSARRVSAARLAITQCTIDGIQHRVQLAGHLMVAEANYSIAQLVEKGRRQRIVAPRVRLGRLIAINLDHQALASAARIRELVSNRMLAPEFKSGKTPGPQIRPEFALNVGSLATKSPAAVARVLVARNHRVARPGTGALKKDPLWPQTAISPFQVERITRRNVQPPRTGFPALESLSQAVKQRW